MSIFVTLQAAEGDTRINIDPSILHHQRLKEANQGLDSLLSHGGNVIGSLKDQGFTLKVLFMLSFNCGMCVCLSHVVFYFHPCHLPFPPPSPTGLLVT